MESRETSNSNDVVTVNDTQWRWWFLASVTQFSWGVYLWRRPYNGSATLLPLKAFFVGSLFPGSLFTASIASLQASGIHKVEELVDAGQNLRKCLRVRPTSEKEAPNMFS